jgi:hypothetical protein
VQVRFELAPFGVLGFHNAAGGGPRLVARDLVERTRAAGNFTRA